MKGTSIVETWLTTYQENNLSRHYQENFLNTKTVWSKRKEILQHNEKKSDNIFLDINGQAVSNHKLVANELSNYFINVAENLLKGLGGTYNQFQNYLKNLSKRN